VCFVFVVFAENPPLSSIQSQILSNGTSVPYRIERAKDLPSIWFIKFRPYTSGLHQISLISNGISLLSTSDEYNQFLSLSLPLICWSIYLEINQSERNIISLNGICIIILGSPYQIQVKDSPTERVLLEGLEQIQYTNSPCVIQGNQFDKSSIFSIFFINNLSVHAENASTAQIRVVVLLGSRQIPSTTAIINNNLIRIQFIPQEPGLYAVHVSCLNLPIEGNQTSIIVTNSRMIFFKVHHFRFVSNVHKLFESQANVFIVYVYMISAYFVFIVIDNEVQFKRKSTVIDFPCFCFVCVFICLS